MKGILTLSMLLLPLIAAAEPGKAELTLLTGGVFPLTKYRTGDKVAKPGFAIGARGLLSAAPDVSVGAEVLVMKPGENSKTTAFDDETSSYDSIVAMVEARAAVPDGPVRPFGLVGLGIHSTRLTVRSQPKPGLLWLDTGTSEKRDFFNSSQTGFAGTIQAGLDFILNEHASLGISGAWYKFAGATWEAEPAFKKQGLNGASAALATAALLGSFSYRF